MKRNHNFQASWDLFSEWDTFFAEEEAAWIVLAFFEELVLEKPDVFMV